MPHLARGPDAEKFVDLEQKVQSAQIQEFLVRRYGASREKASTFTPQAIKNLRPDRPGIWLVWQISASAFEAYFPKDAFKIQEEDEQAQDAKPDAPRTRKRAKTAAASNLKKHVTRSRKYGVVRTQQAALWQCVCFLWKMHQKAGGEPWLRRSVVVIVPVCLGFKLFWNSGINCCRGPASSNSGSVAPF